jgi:hypothetical protein
LSTAKLFRSVCVARGTLSVPLTLMLQRNSTRALGKCAREKGENVPIRLPDAALRADLPAVWS